jgi:hypothetical protein
VKGGEALLLRTILNDHENEDNENGRDGAA